MFKNQEPRFREAGEVQTVKQLSNSTGSTSPQTTLRDGDSRCANGKIPPEHTNGEQPELQPQGSAVPQGSERCYDIRREELLPAHLPHHRAGGVNKASPPSHQVTGSHKDRAAEAWKSSSDTGTRVPAHAREMHYDVILNYFFSDVPMYMCLLVQVPSRPERPTRAAACDGHTLVHGQEQGSRALLTTEHPLKLRWSLSRGDKQGLKGELKEVESS